MIVVPAIDIIGGKTVRLERGDYGKRLSYDITPQEAAVKWQDEGAKFLHVVDLDGARCGMPKNLDAVNGIAKSVNIPLEVGGGYRSIDDIQTAIDAGASRVVIGSMAVKDLNFAEKVIKKYGPRVVISIDVLDGKIKIQGWEADAGHDLDFVIKKLKAFGTESINFTDVSRDGTLRGPDIDYLRSFLSRAGLKITYAGGIKTVEHILMIKEIAQLGIEGVITGRAIYEGSLDLGEAIRACETNNTLS